MEERTIYAPRFFARVLDLLLVILITAIIEHVITFIDLNTLICFLAYNVVVILFDGNSLGKFAFNVRIETHSQGIKRIVNLIAREVLFLLLLPLLFFNFLTISSTPLHDRIMTTRVLRDAH